MKAVIRVSVTAWVLAIFAVIEPGFAQNLATFEKAGEYLDTTFKSGPASVTFKRFNNKTNASISTTVDSRTNGKERELVSATIEATAVALEDKIFKYTSDQVKEGKGVLKGKILMKPNGVYELSDVSVSDGSAFSRSIARGSKGEIRKVFVGSKNDTTIQRWILRPVAGNEKDEVELLTRDGQVFSFDEGKKISILALKAGDGSAPTYDYQQKPAHKDKETRTK
jgi:hypothetical protein